MAIVIEDGTGVKGAQTYGAVTAFEAYMLARGTDISAVTTAIKESSLVKATDYIDTRWGLKFKGQRLFRALTSRSQFTLSDQPANGETVTVGSAVAIFKTTLTEPAVDTEAEIGNTLIETLNNLATALANADADSVVVDFLIADPDIATLTCYVVRDGVATTTTASNGSFDAATSAGYSGRPQVLEFPRQYLYDQAGIQVDGVPIKLQEATYEYAYRAQSTILAPDPTVDASGLRVIGRKKKVGPIETDITYAEQQMPVITKPYPAADRLLQEYVSRGGIIRA
jgi:hypothetical protein